MQNFFCKKYLIFMKKRAQGSKMPTLAHVKVNKIRP